MQNSKMTLLRKRDSGTEYENVCNRLSSFPGTLPNQHARGTANALVQDL